jgi:DNA-binding LacI/PurR family transcriptional regulator
MKDASVTIVDVAKAAGVSTATVGRVIGGYGAVSSKTKDRVVYAVRKLGFSPNIIAQGLRSKRTKTIAAIVGSVSNSFFASMIHAIENEASEYGYSVIICNTNEDPEVEYKHIQNLKKRMVDGIILSSAITEEFSPSDCRKNIYVGDLPIVLVDRRVDGLDLDLIESDNFSAGYKATNYLIALGHRKIGILGTGNYSTINDRIAGYKKALLDRRTEFAQDWILITKKEKNVYNYNQREIVNYFLLNKDLTAVMILNNSLAEVVLLGLNKLKIYDERVFSIICWDDSSMNKLLQLTTVLQYPEEIGREAVRRVISRIEGQAQPDEKMNLINTELKIRSSCKPL